MANWPLFTFILGAVEIVGVALMCWIVRHT
jgi:hypothetical protein